MTGRNRPDSPGEQAPGSAVPDALRPGLRRWSNALRWAAARRELAVAAPPAVAAAWLILRAVDPAASWTTVAAVGGATLLAAVGATLARSVRRHRLADVLRALDAAFPDLDDSAALAVRTGRPLNALEALQRDRVRQRMAVHLAAPGPASTVVLLRRPPLRRSATARVAWLTAALILAAAGVLPTLRAGVASVGSAVGSAVRSAMASASAVQTTSSAADPNGGVAGRLTITPPAYLGAAVQTVETLDAQAPADSQVAWSLVLPGQPRSAALAWSDGSRTPLLHEAGRWTATRSVSASMLYRVETDTSAPMREASGPEAVTTTPAARPHRLDVVPDTPPTVAVRAPAATLTLHQRAQAHWDLVFEASDDHGLGPAVLTVTLAQGSGEQIKVSRQDRPLDGVGTDLQRRYATTLDLGSVRMAQGDDVIVQLDVADLRAPSAQHGRSPNLVLRWPAEGSADSAGLDGPVQKAMPTAFRSERQIIIDTEALIAARGGLSADRVAARADGLGVDQKVLRLRYGQFLGEGFERTAEQAPPGVVARADAVLERGEGAGAGASASAERGARPTASERTAFDAAARASLRNLPPEAGSAGRTPTLDAAARGDDVLRNFGHVHDEAGATTLLDPQTQATLRRALAAMWQAELALRQSRLDDALPPEHAALEAIKEVQQTERIYLARAGQNLPEVDATRRLSGDLKGLGDRRQALPAAAADSAPAGAAWQALVDGRRPDLPGLGAWVQQHRDGIADPLAVLAALDRVRQAPDCDGCRDALRARLWPLLPLPPTGVQPRAEPDAAGAAYLQALRPR